MDKGLLTKDVLFRFYNELNEQNYNKIIDHYTDREDRKTAGLVILMYKFIMFDGCNSKFCYVFPTFEESNEFWGDAVRNVFNQFSSIPQFRLLINLKNIHYGYELVDYRGNKLIGQSFENPNDFENHYKFVLIIDPYLANPAVYYEARKNILCGVVPTDGEIIDINTFKYVSKYHEVFCDSTKFSTSE